MESQWREAVQKKEQALRDMEESLQALKAEAELERSRTAEAEWQAMRRAEAEKQRQEELKRLIRAEEARKLQENEVQRMRKELVELRQSIETKQQATAKVKEGFGSSAIKDIASG